VIERTLEKLAARGISDPLREQLRLQLLQNPRYGRNLQDKDARLALISQMGAEKIEEIQRKAMANPRGNILTDTRDIATAAWADMEVSFGKVGEVAIEGAQWSMREMLAHTITPSKGLVSTGEERDAFRKLYDEHFSHKPTVLHEVVDEWEDTANRARQRMTGEIGLLRTLWRGSLELAIGVGQFVAVGATRAGAMGIQGLLAMHANEKGKAVYDETGNKTQAFTAAGLNYLVSNLIFSRAHAPIKKIQQQADKAIRGFDFNQTIKLNKLIATGRIRPATHTLGQIMGVTVTAATLRTAEQGMNSMLQDYVGGKRFDAFENTWENFYATLQSGAWEGLTIAMLPAATKAVGAPFGIKSNIAVKDFYRELEMAGKAGSSMKNLTHRISDLMGKSDVRGLEALALRIKESSGGNMLLEQVAESLLKQAAAKKSGKETVESEVTSIGEPLAELSSGERFEVLRKFSEVVNDIAGEAVSGRDATAVTAEEVKAAKEKQKHETIEDKYDRLFRESLEATRDKIKDTLPKEVVAAMDAAEKFKITKQMVAVELVGHKATDTLRALREEMAEIEAAGKSTPEATRRKEIVSDLIREMASQVEAQRREGKLEGDVEIKVEVEGKELGAEELLNLLDGRKAKAGEKTFIFDGVDSKGKAVRKIVAKNIDEAMEALGKFVNTEGKISGFFPVSYREVKTSGKDTAKRSKLIEQLREKLNLPEGMSEKALLGKIRSALKKSKEPVKLSTVRQVLKKTLDAVVEGKLEKTTKEEIIAEYETREQAQARDAAEKAESVTRAKAEKIIDRLIKSEAERVKGEKRDKKAEAKARMKAFREVFAGTGLSRNVKNAIFAKVGEFKTDAALRKAIKDAVQTVRAEYHKEATKKLKKALRVRGKKAEIDPVLDDVLTAIIREVDPKHAEKIGQEKGKTIDEALDAYVEMRGEHVRPVAELVRTLSQTKGGVDALTGRQVAFLEQFASGIKKQNSAKRKAQKERKRYEKERIIAETNADTQATWNLSKHDVTVDALGNVTDIAPWAKDLIGISKTFSWGIEANARLTDAIEYITGSNSTIAHDVMVKDVINGQSNASMALANAHRLWEATLKANDLKPEDLFEVSDANKKGRKSGKNVIEVNGAGTITRAQLIGYLMQIKDASTLSKFLSGKNKLNFEVEGEKGHVKEKEWGEEQHSALMEHVGREFAREAKIAEILVEIINHPTIVKPLRAWGIEYYGYDMIQPGTYVMRSVRRGKKDVEVAPKSVDGILGSLSEFTGISEAVLHNVDMSAGKARVEKHTQSINIGDGIIATTRYLRATTTLTNLQPALKRAMDIATSPDFLAATSQKGPTGAIAGGLVENYYKPIIEQASAVVRNRSDLGNWISKGRNNVVNAVLWGKITIPAYQPISEIAAASYMGAKGQRFMLQANRELGLWKWGRASRQACLERMLGPGGSGLAWERFQIANSYMLMAGEGIQTKHGSITIAGKRQGKGSKWLSMITLADRHAILRIYRAAELKVEDIFRSKGMEVNHNSPLFREMVRRTFEDVVVETQPTYEASMQPALLNRAKQEPAVSAFTMFRGYTGKLTAMQRIAITRARRAYRAGNVKEAEMHLRKMVEQTIVGSGFVAILRKVIKTGIRGGIGLAVGRGLVQPEQEEMTEYVKEMVSDVISQATGMTIGGGILTDIVKPLLGFEGYRPGLTPLTDTIETAMRTSGALSRGEGGAMTWLAFAKSSGALFGLPTVYIEMIQDIIRQHEKMQKEQYIENMIPR